MRELKILEESLVTEACCPVWCEWDWAERWGGPALPPQRTRKTWLDGFSVKSRFSGIWEKSVADGGFQPEPCRWWVSTRLIRSYSAPPTWHLCDFRWQAGCPWASWPCVSFARADFIGAVLTIEILPQGSGFLPEIPAKFFALLSLNHSLGAKTKLLAARVLLPQARPLRAPVVWGDSCVGSCLPDSFAPWEGNAATFPGPSTKSYFLAF